MASRWEWINLIFHTFPSCQTVEPLETAGGSKKKKITQREPTRTHRTKCKLQNQTHNLLAERQQFQPLRHHATQKKQSWQYTQCTQTKDNANYTLLLKPRLLAGIRSVFELVGHKTARSIRETNFAYNPSRCLSARVCNVNLHSSWQWMDVPEKSTWLMHKGEPSDDVISTSQMSSLIDSSKGGQDESSSPPLPPPGDCWPSSLSPSSPPVPHSAFPLIFPRLLSHTAMFFFSSLFFRRSVHTHMLRHTSRPGDSWGSYLRSTSPAAGPPFHSPAKTGRIYSLPRLPYVHHWIISPLHLPLFSPPPPTTFPSPPLASVHSRRTCCDWSTLSTAWRASGTCWSLEGWATAPACGQLSQSQTCRDVFLRVLRFLQMFVKEGTLMKVSKKSRQPRHLFLVKKN